LLALSSRVRRRSANAGPPNPGIREPVPATERSRRPIAADHQPSCDDGRRAEAMDLHVLVCAVSTVSGPATISRNTSSADRLSDRLRCKRIPLPATVETERHRGGSNPRAQSSSSEGAPAPRYPVHWASDRRGLRALHEGRTWSSVLHESQELAWRAAGDE